MAFFLLTILFGGVFITSEHFMNVENDAKAYYIGVLLILILQVCSFSRKGLSRFIAALSTIGIGIGFSIVCFILSIYGCTRRKLCRSHCFLGNEIIKKNMNLK